MKRLVTLFTLLAAFASTGAFAQDRYISEDLFTYMHSGPGTQYRIIGSVDAGEKVTVLSSQSDYTQIVDTRGRKGWVDSKYISRQPGLKERLPALQNELKQVKSALAKAEGEAHSKQEGLLESLDQRNSQIKELEKYNADLNQKLIDSQAETRELRARLDTQKDDLLMRWFTYGGLVAGAGLILGLILPHIIPRRKKTNDRWM
ncbi:TIGR04211 family SH3 domain-containing protein [Parasalinivibrio latis]|uniref:TIGR04211 family SH3 domain-containing protein n=1 Tax=Parasalinivibrio latis TaxID=2952610 RepID=UPI0030E16E7A